MPFPLSYWGEIDWFRPEPLNKNHFRTVMSAALRDVGLKQVHASDARINFGAGSQRWLSLWNALAVVKSGDIEIRENDGRIAIEYRLYTKIYIVLLGLVVAIPFVWITFSFEGSVWSRVGILLLVWLLFVGVNYLYSVFLFQSLMRRTLRQI
jgi:hypothetical protein